MSFLDKLKILDFLFHEHQPHVWSFYNCSRPRINKRPLRPQPWDSTKRSWFDSPAIKKEQCINKLKGIVEGHTMYRTIPILTGHHVSIDALNLGFTQVDMRSKWVFVFYDIACLNFTEAKHYKLWGHRRVCLVVMVPELFEMRASRSEHPTPIKKEEAVPMHLATRSSEESRFRKSAIIGFEWERNFSL